MTRRRSSLLTQPGWAPAAQAQLERIIRDGAGQGLPVTFDFDNTLVCGDIGEATLAVLARDQRLPEPNAQPPISPAFRNRNGELIQARTALDPTAYYEAYLDPTIHGAADPWPQANGYLWAVEAMAGLSPLDVIRATETAYRCAEPGAIRMIEVSPGKTAYPAPFFYPEMIELVAALLEHQFDVWIVSASNVWSVRWMILHALNPRLRRLRSRRGVAPEHVIGVSTLLEDAEQRWYKDAVLVRRDRAYRRLEPRALQAFRLTSRLQFPAPTYSGKVACIWDHIGRHPYLAAGDSPGDHAMLGFAEHRLWIARLDKPKYQQATTVLRRRTYPDRWIVQPVWTKAEPGFRPVSPANPAA